MRISSSLHHKFKSAAKGKKCFLRFSRNIRNRKKTAYLIFPEHSPEINYYGLLYLDEFLLRSDFNKAVIITSDKNVLSLADKFSRNISSLISVSDDEASHIIDYYSMIPFSNAVRIVSLDAPHGRRGSNLLGRNKLSVEQIVAIGVYFLLPFERISSGNISVDDMRYRKSFAGSGAC